MKRIVAGAAAACLVAGSAGATVYDITTDVPKTISLSAGTYAATVTYAGVISNYKSGPFMCNAQGEACKAGFYGELKLTVLGHASQILQNDHSLYQTPTQSTDYYGSLGPLIITLDTPTTVLAEAPQFDSLSAGHLTFNLVQIGGGSTVPEPATWAMFIGGFGLIGSALRRRQKVSVSFA